MKKNSFLRTLFTIILSALICSTVLIFFSPGGEYVAPPQQSLDDEIRAQDETESTAGEKKIIGLVAGHYGYDIGCQCGGERNFVNEADVNLRIAVMVRDYLTKRGYSVDLMHEYDNRLTDYTALALVAIHTDSCEERKTGTTSGFSISTVGANRYPSEGKRLNECLQSRYTQNTGLTFNGPTINAEEDKTLYTFDSVNDYTTVSLFHAGYLYGDYRTLSERMDQVAKGIGDGIICYVESESIGLLKDPNPIEPLYKEDTGQIYKFTLSDTLSRFY